MKNDFILELFLNYQENNLSNVGNDEFQIGTKENLIKYLTQVDIEQKADGIDSTYVNDFNVLSKDVKDVTVIITTNTKFASMVKVESYTYYLNELLIEIKENIENDSSEDAIEDLAFRLNVKEDKLIKIVKMFGCYF